MKSRCWTLLCLIFLSDLVRLSRTDTLGDSNQVQQDILYHGESSEPSGYLQEVGPQDNSEGLLQAPMNVSLVTRKNKQLCPQGAANVGIPKRNGRRSIREEDNSFVNSELNHKVRKCSCSKIRTRKRMEMLTRTKLDSNVSNSKEASFVVNGRTQTSSESIISIAPVTTTTQRPLESTKANFYETSTTSASMTTLLNKIMEDASTDIDIKYTSTVSPNVDFNDVGRSEENLSLNSNFTNSTTDVAEPLWINDSFVTTSTEKSTDLLPTISESVTERRSMSGTTPLEGRRNNNQNENLIKNLPRRKKCKRKRKKPKAMLLLKGKTTAVDSGHNHTIQSNLVPISPEATPVTHKSSSGLISNQAIPTWRKQSPAPTSVHTTPVTQQPGINDQQTQETWSNFMLTTRKPKRVSQNGWNYNNYPDYSKFDY
ncbi:uncharacterized protein LOC107267745 isoform X2 [Cephus cinctus]|uniref:Uncharacterized protein LOC107267745 isoform X2 n=1 Tax=Cephus cinctus TaxID=211228 RepID=A0AAJ7RHW2_CEPCN|nr:uncharacterized protein LOC107267745 isoform X2 [Cephus cinctus]